ncbi:MAG: putative acetyltransferase [Firmicutes bacterium ADurb.Bin153]|nr:MAG: putative acetyltransferase [Firmicutes bacterium ADurb.Bin153]
MYTYVTLDKISLPDLHKAFTDAFSDYQVSTEMPLLMFEQFLRRNGYVPEASVGAVKDGALVGFFLNGVRRLDGRLTAYDTGTAVVQSHRRQGVTSGMFEHVKQVLKGMGVERCLLEVIKSNTSAYELYIKQGFRVIRDFECFVLNGPGPARTSGYEVLPFDPADELAWSELGRFRDFEPSWQNSTDSILSVPGRFAYASVRIGDAIAGYGLIDRQTGDVPQIAVDRRHRGKGVGSCIMAHLAESTSSGRIKVINVDSRCASALSFLRSIGAGPFVNQHEMFLDL